MSIVLEWYRQHLEKSLRAKYSQVKDDIGDYETINNIFEPFGFNAAGDPITVADINVYERLNRLEATRPFAGETVLSIASEGNRFMPRDSGA